MKKLKVVVIGPIPPPYTGMSVVTEMLLDSHLINEFEAIHLDTTDKREIRNMGKLDAVNTILAFKHFFKALWICLKVKPDLVYLPISQNFFGYLRDSLFLIPCRLLRIRIVVHLHGGYFKDFYEKLNFLMKKLVKFSLERISAAIVLGESLKYIFKGLVPKERIFVVPNGVDDYLDSHGHKNSGGVCNILFLSNFIKDKGVFDTLAVIPQIISTHKNVKFTFAGEWCNIQDEKEVRRIIKENAIEANVEFIGVVSKAEKFKLLSKADIFLLPTSYAFEGQPLVILEAMSAGLPVISTRKGAIAETIVDGQNGFLVKSKDPEQLIEKIKILVSDSDLRKKIGEKNRKTYLEKYTKDIFINNLQVIFSDIGERIVAEGTKKLLEHKSRILVVGYLPPPQEGTAKITETIIQSEYLKSDFQIDFLPLSKSTSVTNRGRLSFANLSYNFGNFLKYIQLIVQSRPNIIYMPLAQNRFGFLRDSIFIISGKFFQRKIYVHFHGGNFDLFYEMQKNVFKKYIKLTLGCIDKLIVLADKFRKQFSTFIREEKITFVYNCVPKLPDMPQGYENNFSKKKVSRILFMGYISKAKGALDLVKAIPDVMEKYKNPVEFVLCGQPVNIERNVIFIPEPHFGFSKINSFIMENNLKDYVKIYPEVSGVEKSIRFLEADIFVFPSYSEGCGLVVLEAMSFGLPVITTPVGALAEMLEQDKNCLFVRPNDTKNLSKAILSLLNNTLLCEKIGEANKRLIEERYNSDIFLQNLACIWGREVKSEAV